MRAVDCDYYTDAITYTRVTILDVFATESAAPSAPGPARPGSALPERRPSLAGPDRHLPLKSHGDVRVVSRVVGFKKIKFYTNENVGSGELDLPEQQMHTTSYWLTLPRQLMATLPYSLEDRRDGVVGLAFAMRQVAQLLLMCDRQDIGISIGAGDEGAGRAGAALTLQDLDEPRIFIYDSYPGGIGFSEPLFAMHDELVAAHARADRRLPVRSRLPDLCRSGGRDGTRGQAGRAADSRSAHREARGMSARLEQRAARRSCGSRRDTRVRASTRQSSDTITTPRRHDGAKRLRTNPPTPVCAPLPRRSVATSSSATAAWRSSSIASIPPTIGTACCASATCPDCALAAAPELSLLGGVPEPLDRDPRALLFVDLETTGLAGGAGTYAFLVGCAFFEPHGFRIRQYFLPRLPARAPAAGGSRGAGARGRRRW